MLRRRIDHPRRPPNPKWLGTFLVVIVMSCTTGAGVDQRSPSARPSRADVTADRSIGPSTSSIAGGPGSALLTALPDEVFGHTLTKVIATSGATGRVGWLRDLLVELGRDPSDLTEALAYDPGFPDLRVLAISVRGVAADRLLTAYLAVTARAVDDFRPEARSFGGKHAICFDVSPASPMDSCVGTRSDVLFVVTSSEYVHITEAIKVLL